MVRMFFNIPRQTHRNLSEPISGTSHLKIKFYQSVEKCDKPHLKYLLKIQKNDVRSVFGRNVMNICNESGTDNISLVKIENIHYCQLQIEDHWRPPMVKELLDARAGRVDIGLTRREISTLIYEVTTS